ncbi:hypothetical protein Tco_0738865 [Tanacetum coccineum]
MIKTLDHLSSFLDELDDRGLPKCHASWVEWGCGPRGGSSRLCARASNLVDDMHFHTRACKGRYTPMVFCKLFGRPKSAHLVCRPQRQGSRHGPFKNSFQATIGYLNLPTCLWVIRGGETMSDSVFKHDLCKLVIAKMGSAITYDSTRGTESGDGLDLRNLQNNSSVVGGERFRFNPF